jgi:hypothetical protein
MSGVIYSDDTDFEPHVFRTDSQKHFDRDAITPVFHDFSYQVRYEPLESWDSYYMKGVLNGRLAVKLISILISWSTRLARHNSFSTEVENVSLSSAAATGRG